MSEIIGNSSGPILERFLAAMDGEWTVDGYEVQADGRVKVTYVSKDDSDIEWSHRPFTIAQILPIGTTVRIGAIVAREEQTSESE